MHEKCDFNEKERVFRSYLHLRTKILEDLRKKTTTTTTTTKRKKDWIGQGEKVRKSSKKLFEIVKNT